MNSLTVITELKMSIIECQSQLIVVISDSTVVPYQKCNSPEKPSHDDALTSDDFDIFHNWT